MLHELILYRASSGPSISLPSSERAEYFFTERAELLWFSIFVFAINVINAFFYYSILGSLIAVKAAIIVGEVWSTKTNKRRGLNIRRGIFYAETQLYRKLQIAYLFRLKKFVAIQMNKILGTFLYEFLKKGEKSSKLISVGSLIRP